MYRSRDDHATNRWAAFRFAVIGGLLASPPGRGELRSALEDLSSRTWEHPTTRKPVRFSVATLERWLYLARRVPNDPVSALRRQVRKDAGKQPSLSERLLTVMRQQYRDHPGWSMRLHYDNLESLCRKDPSLGPIPSVATIRRAMHARGLTRKRPLSRRQTEATERAAQRLEKREVRSYQATHVGGLWHADFHQGSRKVLLASGVRHTPHLFGVLDDRSRVCAHLQWYLDETAESYAHGLMQGMQKRGRCRSLMDDNGSAMVAAEIEQGLLDLGIVHEHTLAESPYQNGKQERFWHTVEVRLMAMLEGIDELSLDFLNEATQAWVELEYNRRVHEEIGVPPLVRFLEGPDVLRPCPSSDALRRCFRLKTERTQRRSDGTVSIEGQRFEIPARFQHIKKITIRYARWDLSRVDMVDPRHGTILARLYPQDKEKNADGRRRRLDATQTLEPRPKTRKIAPLLDSLIADYAATGLPPAYLPRRTDTTDDTE